MKNISALIDKGTNVRRTMIPVAINKYIASGYVVFVCGGKMIERAIRQDKKNGCVFIVFKCEKYKIDIPADPIYGAFNVQALREYWA